jgi:hypothetical protein
MIKCASSRVIESACRLGAATHPARVSAAESFRLLVRLIEVVRHFEGVLKAKIGALSILRDSKRILMVVPDRERAFSPPASLTD